MTTGTTPTRGRRPRRRTRSIPILVLALLGFGAPGCFLTSPLYVEPAYSPETPKPDGPEWVVAPAVDGRVFTDSANRAPVPSVQGDPGDVALTSRTIGRRLVGQSLLGANVTLPPGESVAGWVDRAVVEGLRRAGAAAVPLDATAAAKGAAAPVTVTVLGFWLDVKPNTAQAVVEYRAEVLLQGGAGSRFATGRSVRARGTVSAGGLDYTLWRRAFDRALDEIAAETARVADPRRVTS